MAGGRPTKYEPWMCEKVIEYGAEGKSKTWMAAQLKISKQRLYDWEEAHEEFRDAITYAMTLSQAWWEDAGQNNLLTPQFQSSVYSRSMGARFPDDWRESRSVEGNLKVDQKTKLDASVELRPQLTKEEWLKAHGLEPSAGAAE